MQICGHNGVEARGLGHHARGHGVDEHFVPGDVWKFFCNLGGDLVPHNHAVTLRVGFGDNRQQLARTVLGKLESEAHDARYATAGEDGSFRGDLFRETAVGAAALASIFAFGVFADNGPIQIARLTVAQWR